MTLAQLQALLEAIGPPVHYRQSEDETVLPRIVFRDWLISPASASGRIFRRTRFVDIGLYNADPNAGWAEKVFEALVQAGMQPRETIRDEVDPRCILHAWEVQWDELNDA